MNAPHMLYLDKEGAGSIVADPENGRLVVSNEAAQQTVFVRISPAEMRDLGKKLIALADELGGE